MISTLERAGLSHNESVVYFTLLQTGMCMAGKISKKSQINRTTTYDILNNLYKKGLVRHNIISNKKFFECVDPDILLEFLKERENDINDILPHLKNIYMKPQTDHNVTLYYGYSGVKNVFQMILKEAKEVCVMDSEGQLIEKMPTFAKYFIKQLDKRKIKVLYLVRKGKEHSNPSNTTEIRFIKKKTASEAVFNIYNDKLIIFIWTNPPEVVVIQNKAAADSMKDYFFMIWNKSAKN